MNKKVYFVTIIISLLLLIPYCIWDCNVFTVLSGIGCSGIAAAIMAIFLEMTAIKKESERKAKTRTIYFRELKEQLKMMLERILWFDERMNDDFDWSKDSSSYASFQYMIYANQKYPSGEIISFQEAEKRLNILKEKYSLDKQSIMPREQLQKSQKLFSIVAASSQPLLIEINSIRENKIELNAEDYLSLEEIDNLYFQVTLAVSLMYKPNKNYEVAVDSLMSAYKTICITGNFTDEITIGLHGTIKMNEI